MRPSQGFYEYTLQATRYGTCLLAIQSAYSTLPTFTPIAHAAAQLPCSQSCKYVAKHTTRASTEQSPGQRRIAHSSCGAQDAARAHGSPKAGPKMTIYLSLSLSLALSLSLYIYIYILYIYIYILCVYIYIYIYTYGLRRVEHLADTVQLLRGILHVSCGETLGPVQPLSL